MRQGNQIIMVIYFSIFSMLFSTAQELDRKLLVTADNITIVDCTGISTNDQHPVALGKREFFNAIEAAGGTIENVQHWTQTNRSIYLILGTLDNTIVRRLVSDDTELISKKPEGVFYQWKSTNRGMALVVGGTDNKGLMYALTELAQQINDKGLTVLNTIKNTKEFPDNVVRGLDKFITDEYDDAWFFSEDYWQYYIGQLAQNRFNRLTLITGYNDGKNEDFMIPVYPYLLKTSGFEGVVLKKKLQKTPDDYLKQLRRVGEICHNYGIEFVFGIWGHGRSETLLSGLPQDADMYTAFCAQGMRTLLRSAPEIDGIQLRVNYESGVGGFGDTAEKFWKEIILAMGDIHKERQGNLFLDIRAKGLTTKIRQWALDTGINVSVTSKYSWEGMGLPYHPTEMRKGELSNLDNIDLRQRYGYADFLQNTREFDYINRLWGIGTLRIFTWADPIYAKHFSKTTSFGSAKGFQVTPPLARKQNTWSLFAKDSLNFFKWEDERYWAWYTLFGRLGYNNEASPEVWERVFKRHYGASYKAVLEAYMAAGKILPLITSSHLTYHPANYNWAEMDSGGALFVKNNANPYHSIKGRSYQSAEPGDPGLFYGIEQYVKDFLKSNLKPKINPLQLVSLYNNFSNQTLEAIEKVDNRDIPYLYRKEYTSNEIDLRITAALAKYHAYKIKAATDFVFFQETNNKAYLNACLSSLNNAKDQWSYIVNITNIYNAKPLFLHDNGSWRDRLVEIEKDIAEVRKLSKPTKNLAIVSHWDAFKDTDFLLQSNFEAVVPKIDNSNIPLQVTLITGKPLNDNSPPLVHYREANMAAGKFKTIKMTWDGENYKADIPANSLNTNYNLLVYFTSINNKGQVTMYPGLYNTEQNMPYYVVHFKNEN